MHCLPITLFCCIVLVPMMLKIICDSFDLDPSIQWRVVCWKESFSVFVYILFTSFRFWMLSLSINIVCVLVNVYKSRKTNRCKVTVHVQLSSSSSSFFFSFLLFLKKNSSQWRLWDGLCCCWVFFVGFFSPLNFC